MTRLTETEISIIQRSKAQAAGDWMDIDRAILEARRARALYMNRILVKAGTQAWRASGLGGLICAARRALARHRTLAELNFNKVDVRVTAIKRGGIRGPQPALDTRLLAGDVLVLYGTPATLEEAEEALMKG